MRGARVFGASEDSLAGGALEANGSSAASAFAEANAFAERVVSLFPDTAYVQAVRCQGNEEDLDAFYRGWKAKTPNVIIQKYDHFAGRLEERKVVDLSPIVRRPCWHLARDLSVLLDGSVPACKDMSLGHGVESLGNALEPGGLAKAWAAGAARFEAHARGDYEGPCGGCDEYYTYNF